MKKIVRVAVVDDHPLMARATGQLLENIDSLELVGIAEDGKSCLELVERERPEVVFLDYQLPDCTGTQLIQELKTRHPQIRIVVFSGVDISDMLLTFLGLGVSGVISKETDETTLRAMIVCILNHQIVLPRSLLTKLKLPVPDVTQEVELTENEVIIMSMVVKGATHEQIADRIHASKRSVDNYLKRIYDKYGVQTRIQAVERFIRSQYYVADAAGKED